MFRINSEVQNCIYLHLYICQYVCIEQKFKTLYGTSEEEELNGKFSILVFKNFGVGTKFGQKIKSVYCVKVVENGTETFGAYKNTF